MLGGSDYCAPGQLVGDFLRGVASTQLGEVMPSYTPGVRLGDLSQALPDYAIDAIREALPAFGKQIRGFDRDDAVLTGVETRTSSPVRITRDAESLQSLNMRGLYPAAKARAMPAASFRQASTASKWPKRSRGAWREIRRHQKTPSEEVPRGVTAASWWKASTWCRSCRRRWLMMRACAPVKSISPGNMSTGRARCQVHVVNSRHMTQLSETRSPQGIAAVVPLLAAPAPQPGERAIYLHEIQDPGNLGTILRTLAWFGRFRCLLSPNSVDVHNGKAVRASMGAIFHVPVEIDVPIDALPARFASDRQSGFAGSADRCAGVSRLRLLRLRQ